MKSAWSRLCQWLRSVALAALLLATALSAEASIVLDSATGKPIAGATVYVVSYDRAWLGDREGCGGETVATTQADGTFDVGWNMTWRRWLHKTVYWVVATGYRGASYTSGDGSVSLQTLDGLSLEEKLRAAAPPQPYDYCYSGWIPSGIGARQFDFALRAVRLALVCNPANGDATPQTDVFLRYFPLGYQTPLLWRAFVTPLLPRQTSHPVPKLARDNACAVAANMNDPDPRFGRNAEQHTHLSGPLTLRVSLHRMDENLTQSGIPIRLLWGARMQPERSSERIAHILPLYGAVAYTDADGNADFAVTQAMLDEQDLRPGEYNRTPHLEFAAIPYAADRIALDPRGRELPSGCGTECVTPHLRAPSGQQEGIILLPGFPQQGNDAFVRLRAILERDKPLRSGIEDVVTDRTTLRAYAWTWPIGSLQSRTFELIAQTADVENDTQALLRLQRGEVTRVFDTLCAQPSDAPAAGPGSLLQLLWWADVQVNGPDTADWNAQSRALQWDNGVRCVERNGRPSVDSTSPPNPLRSGTVCAVWQNLRTRLDANLDANETRLADMHVDFSKRDGACPQKPDFGSSL